MDAIPPRRDLRNLVIEFEKKNTAKAVTIFLSDYALFFAGSLAAIILPLHLKIFGAALVWISIARLFIVGHDACHGSFTASRPLNRLLGKIAFLPSLTPFRWWEVGHNMAHHGFGNLVGKDYVWIPLSVEEYQRLAPLQKKWYRWTRGVFGSGLYYFFSLWWSELLIFRSRQAGKLELDTLFVCCFAAIWIATIWVLSSSIGESFVLAVTFAFVLPFVAWNFLMGLVIYVHHTHPDVKWYRDQKAWIESKPYLTATVNVRFPSWFSASLHHIMEHPAHHLAPAIPMYNLAAAQRKLEAAIGKHFVSQEFSFAWYLKCTRVCKLYDFEKQCWVPFKARGQ